MTTKDIIDLISSIGTLILSLLAFCFSLYAYRKVSLKNDFKKKQLDTVYELIEILQDTIIHVYDHGVHDNPSISSGSMFRFFRLRFFNNKYKEGVKTKAFLVTHDPDREFEFIKFSEHPYMVPEIAKIIREFVAYTNEPVDIRQLESFTVLGGCGIIEMDGKHFQINDNPVYANFETFCLKCKELDKAIHKWLKSIGIDGFNKKEIIE